MNTCFQKTPNEVVTYKEKNHLEENEADDGPPYDYTKYAQCDYILTKSNDKGIFKDVFTYIGAPHSDTLPTLATIHLDLRIEDGTKATEEHTKFNKPDEERWVQCDKRIGELIGDNFRHDI